MLFLGDYKSQNATPPASFLIGQACGKRGRGLVGILGYVVPAQVARPDRGHLLVIRFVLEGGWGTGHADADEGGLG